MAASMPCIVRTLAVIIAVSLGGCTEGYEGAPAGAGTSTAMSEGWQGGDDAALIDGYKISPLDWETGGVTPDGVYYSESVPGIEITSVSAATLTEADHERALAVALRWCQAQGKREWESDETSGLYTSYFEEVWYIPGRCLD